MDERSIALVEESYRKLLPISKRAGSIFVARLRDRHRQEFSNLAKVFDARPDHVVPMLGIFVTNLRDPRSLWPALRLFARTSSVEQLLDAHNAAVEIAVIWTLRLSLRENFTPEMETAWIRVITALSLSAAKAKADFATLRSEGVTLH